jgi:hypothetical protein
MAFTPGVLDELRGAKHALEQTSLAARIANAVGAPVEKILGALPERASKMVLDVTNKSLTDALDFAITTLGRTQPQSSALRHKVAVAVSGAAGGALGLPGLAVELPVSTILMLRSIADIARAEGESIALPEAKLACLQVFSFGGPKRTDDAVESGYFAARAALASAVTEAAEYIAKHGVVRAGAPPLVRFTAQIAARFGIPVSEKVLAQSVPLIGAGGGALINLLFIDHFQTLARGHFTVRRLERTFGSDAVKQAYLQV